MRRELIKTTIYYPDILHKALKELQENDIKGRTINQLAVDILIESKDIKAVIEKK